MNKVILLGRLTKEPELKYTSANNTPVCTFTLAVNRRFDKDNVDYIQIVAWNKTAEFCGKYFQKGRQVAVVGRIQTRTWDDNEGKRRYNTDVVAEECYFADSKKDSGNSDLNQENMQFDIIDDSELPF
jgi:single-strand DNA-binding protein